MRRNDKEITGKEILEEIMLKSQICRLGLVSDGEAYIVPVNYAYEDGLIYIHSAPEGRKIDILKQNNQVSFEIELSGEITRGSLPCQWSSKYRSVMGRGSVSIENDMATKKKGLNLIMHKYGADTDLKYDRAALSNLVILKLRIISLTGKQSGIW